MDPCTTTPGRAAALAPLHIEADDMRPLQLCRAAARPVRYNARIKTLNLKVNRHKQRYNYNSETLN